jgi:glutathionylspermidine synthase
MRREASTPRRDWRRTVESQGLVYPVTVGEDGTETPYWYEDAAYVLDEWEVEHLEDVTERLHGMCIEAAYHLATGAYGTLGLAPRVLDLARESLELDPVSVYGRFDLRYDGEGPAQLYEYNADTPTGLIESSVAQWYWLQDVHPERDQWNSLHERMIAVWRKNASRIGPVLHLAHSEVETSGEEWMTVAYLRDTADQAGLNTVGMTMEQIGFDHDRRRFVDPEGRVINCCFKLYPWEDMLSDEFGDRVLADPDATRWIEPLWKVLLSNKALLAALWALYPGHENLLPSYLDRPWGMDSYIAKPLHGREGDGMRWTLDGTEHKSPAQHYGSEGYCYQLWAPPPSFDGAHPVFGSWVVDGNAAGLGIRESDGPITDYWARFVPHYIDAPTPGKDQRAAWLKEDGVKP